MKIGLVGFAGSGKTTVFNGFAFLTDKPLLVVRNRSEDEASQLEGKDYIVADGDIMSIRFNV